MLVFENPPPHKASEGLALWWEAEFLRSAIMMEVKGKVIANGEQPSASGLQPLLSCSGTADCLLRQLTDGESVLPPFPPPKLSP